MYNLQEMTWLDSNIWNKLQTTTDLYVQGTDSERQ